MRIEGYNVSPEASLDDDPETQRVFALLETTMPDNVRTDNQYLQDTLLDLAESDTFFVARDGENEIVGVSSHYLPEDEDYLFLSAIATNREAQGQRTGTQLMSNLSREATDHNRSAIEFWSLPDAVGFYHKLGATALRGNRMRLETDQLPSLDT